MKAEMRSRGEAHELRVCFALQPQQSELFSHSRRYMQRTASSSTVGQRGNWATSVAEIGQRAGIFKKHGLALELLYTQGSGETQQAVIAGSVDIGIAPGTMGAMSAFAKGAPVRIIGAETTGASDIYWYVKANSPITSLKDFDGKTVAYSTTGSSTHMVVSAFMKELGLKLKPIATGRADTHAHPGHVRARSTSAGPLHPMGSINSTAGIFAASQVATTL